MVVISLGITPASYPNHAPANLSLPSMAHEPLASALICIALHRDGCRAVSGSADGELRIWDPRASRCLRAIDAHTGRITAVAIDPEAGQILSTSWDKSLKTWDVESGDCLRTLFGHSKLFGVSERAYRSDGHRVVSRSFDYRTLKIWSPSGGSRAETLIHHQAGF